jgi:predicted HTH transcriptional regulator
VRQAKKNPAIEHAALKTMCAFLNSKGGTLLIGVEDNGEITGIEKDQFANDDKFLLHLWNLIKASLGQEASPYITTTLAKIHEKSVCRVECRPGTRPVFLRQKGFGEEFYIRTGPGSSSLSISETMEYIADHFNGT